MKDCKLTIGGTGAMSRRTFCSALAGTLVGAGFFPPRLQAKLLRAIQENEIRRVITENSLTSVDDVTNYCKAGGGCGMCRPEIQKLIDLVQNDRTTPPAQPAPATHKKMSNIQRMKLIEEIVDREIRPQLRRDGGDIELLDIEGDKVVIAFRGMCAGCTSAPFTRQDFIQGKLREFVSPTLEVVEGTN